VKQVTSVRRFAHGRLGNAGVMTSAPLDLDLDLDLAPTTEPAAAPTTAAERRAAAALRRATEDAANAARIRRHDRVAFGALILGLVISMGAFSLVAYENSIAQGTPTSASTTP
jgi:hypothetical protein